MPPQFNFFNPANRLDTFVASQQQQARAQSQQAQNEFQRQALQGQLQQIDPGLPQSEKLASAAQIYNTGGFAKQAKLATESALKAKELEDLQSQGISEKMLASAVYAKGLSNSPAAFNRYMKQKILDIEAAGEDPKDSKELLDIYNDPEQGPQEASIILNAMAGKASALLDMENPSALQNVEMLPDGSGYSGFDPVSQSARIIEFPEGFNIETDKEITAKKTSDAAKIVREDKLFQRKVEKGKTQFAQANTIRDEYDRINSEFQSLEGTLQRIRTASPTGVGDITLLYGIMKLNDPGAAVQEGDKANATNAGGVPASIRAQYNRLIGGGTFGQTERDQFKAEAENIFNSQVELYNNRLDKKLNIAESFGIPEIQITGQEGAPAPGAQQAPDGKWYIETSPGKFSEVQ